MQDQTKSFLRAFVTDWASVIGIALVLALFGPYETFATMSLGVRVAFWLAAAIITTAVVRGLRWLLQRWSLTKHWPFVPLRLTAAVLGSFPVALATSQLYVALAHVPRADFGLAYIYVLLPTAFFSLLLTSRSLPLFAAKPPAEPVSPSGGVASGVASGVSGGASGGTSDDGAAAFLARHASRFANGSLLALESEDHYLRVHTDQGSELILMRLRDAMAQLGDVPGLQVHRSFWVARAAVADTERRGNGWQLTLRNKLKVPVSRSYIPALRTAGWLERRSAETV